MGRDILLTAFIVCCSLSLNAQKPELYATLYGGAAKFTGNGAAKNTNMNRWFQSTNGFTSNPYGKKPGLSAGADILLIIPTKFNLLFNFGAGYESLATVTGINYMSPENALSSLAYIPAHGKTTLRTQYLTIFPSLGYRIKAGSIKIDVNAGMVFAPCMNSKEKGEATADANSNYKVSSNTEPAHPRTDIRPSLEAMAHYKKWAFVLGYQWGLKNHKDPLLGSNQQTEAFARFLKLGIAYRVK